MSPIKTLVEVTKHHFYAVIHGHRLNVHPSPQREYTDWKYVDSGMVFGYSDRGYASERIGAERFWIESRWVDKVHVCPKNTKDACPFPLRFGQCPHVKLHKIGDGDQLALEDRAFETCNNEGCPLCVEFKL